MKQISLLIAGLFWLTVSHGQYIYDLKVKTPSNSKDRTMMLDIYRAKLYSEYQQEFVFVVNHFKMGNNYAWLRAEVQRKDGQRFYINEDASSCCHVEALFKKSGTKWLLAESAEFSTDVWWEGIRRRYPAAPIGIF